MRRVLFASLIGLTAIGAWASGKAEATSPQPKVLEISVSYSNQPGEPVDQAVKYWAEIVKKQSNGSIVLTPYPSSQLGSQETVQQQAQMGANIIAISDYGSLADLVPDLGVVNAPYVGTTVDQKLKLIKSPKFQDLIGKLDAKGYHILVDDMYYGTRELLTTKRVTTPAEMNGVKIRVQNLKIAQYWAKAIGAVPTPMALSEAYTSMSTGVVDGIENPPATLYGGKYYELAKYLIMTNHDVHLTPWAVGTAFWNKLTPDQQKLLSSTGKEFSAYATKLIDSSQQDYINKIEGKGVTVVKVDVAPYLENALKVMKGNFPEWTPGLYEDTLNSLR